jgi:hypothetical protein
MGVTWEVFMGSRLKLIRDIHSANDKLKSIAKRLEIHHKKKTAAASRSKKKKARG